MKKRFILFVLFFIGCGLIAWRYMPCLFNQQPYCFLFPIKGFLKPGTPCFYIQIEDSPILAELDLGYERCVTIDLDILEQLPEKQYLEKIKITNIRGVERLIDIYKIPLIKMGPVGFHDLPIALRDENYVLDTDIVIDEPIQHPSCTIGWGLFRNTNLLLDLPNKQIALCDSLSSLKKTLRRNGYRITKLFSTPLMLDQDFLEIHMRRDNGNIERCILDTGCTWNLLKSDHDSEELLISDLTIEKQNFGSVCFHKMKMGLPIDNILGMEFLYTQTCFINFAENKVYFMEIEQTLPALAKVS
jgi:hypothetical protein